MSKRDEMIRQAILIESGVDIGPGSILKKRAAFMATAPESFFQPPADGGCLSIPTLAHEGPETPEDDFIWPFDTDGEPLDGSFIEIHSSDRYEVQS